MANTIDRKINPEIPIMQESNRNEVYVPDASYTEPGVAGFFKTHFIIDDNGIVHLRKAPERAVSGITYDSNTNTLKITFDDGTVQDIKLNDCACVDGVDLIVYDAFNVITFKETSWDTLDAGKVLKISAALTGYDNDEIIAQLDKYNVVTTNINDGTVTSNYQTDNEYQIYKCTDGSLILFATEAFAGRFIILKREFAVQKNVASITYDDATGILTIYYVTGGSVEVFVKFNLEPGTGDGAVQQIGAKATGKQSAAFGSRRYDKPTDESKRVTEAKGGNAFAAGGSVLADGDFTAAFGKETQAEQSASFAAGTKTQAGKTLEEYIAAGGKEEDYAKSYAAAAVFGDGNKAKGYADFVAGNANESDGTSNTTFGGANKVKGTRNFTGGEANEVGQSGSSGVGNALTFGQHLKNTGRWNRVTFGQFNADDLEALFEIGNGTSDSNRVNIFVVKDNGAVYMGKLGKIHQGTRFQVSDGNSESDRRALIDTRHNGVTHIESYMSTLNGSVGNGNKVAASESGELKDIADPTDDNYPSLNTFLAGQGLQNKGRFNQIIVGQFNEFDPLALFQVGTGESDTNRKKGFRVDFAGRAKSDTAAAGDDFYVRVADLGQEIDFPFGEHSVDYDATENGLTITGTMRIYLNSAKTVYHDIPNVSVSVPIKAGDNINIDKVEDGGWLVISADGSGVDIGAGLPASATNGTLTAEQLALLQSSENNYIMFQHEKYYLEDKGHVEGYITYTHTGYENNTYWIKSITITVSTRAWVLNKGGLAGKGLDFDADGKLQVKAGANLSFGADGTLNASGGGGSVSLPITFSGESLGVGSGASIIRGTYTSGYPAAAMIQLEYSNYKILISPVQMQIQSSDGGHFRNLVLDSIQGIVYDIDSNMYNILRQDNIKTINGESIYGHGNIDAVPYMTDAYTIPTTVTSIAELIPAGYTKYELEIFADTTIKFKVFIDGHESYSNAVYLKLVQTGTSMNALFVTETGNAIHTNNLGGQLKDRITIQGIDSGSPAVYICKKLN